VGDWIHSGERDGGKVQGEERYEISNLNRGGMGSSGRRVTMGSSDLNHSKLNDDEICTDLGTVSMNFGEFPFK
jgi:hypothetical protein